MTKEEIEKHLQVGSTKSVCIDCSLVEKYVYIVRSVHIRTDYVVNIDFDTWGYDEGGVYYEAKYENTDKLIFDLESYLCTKIELWENYTKSGAYPEQPDELEDVDRDKFISDVKNQKIELPTGAKYKILSSYW